MMNSRLVHISKTLSLILRHKASDFNVSIRDDGFVRVSDLLHLPLFKDVTLQDIIEVVNQNEKKRFELKTIDGHSYIRACQGHTISTIKDEELLELIQDSTQLPMCIHGTYYTAWKSIKKQV
ncbi:hypothetical protein WA158_008157 [Blastocystis sp. Blastoise]